MSKDLTEALGNLMKEDSGTNVVPSMKPRGAQPAAKASQPLPGNSGKGGGGMASPLVETAYADRTWHADVESSFNSTDGVFTLKVKTRYVKEIKFTDANQAPQTIELKAPA